MTDSRARVEELAQWFATLTPRSLHDIDKIYAESATFRDPFNQVVGIASIQRIYQHMFETLDEPRFVITTKLVDATGAFMTWQFLFTLHNKAYKIEGGTHFNLDEHGLIVLHRDYWDAAQELYEKIPVLGAVLRLLRKKLSVRP